MSGAAYMRAAPTVGVERRERLDRLGDSRVKPGEDHPDDGWWRVICLQPLARSGDLSPWLRALDQSTHAAERSCRRPFPRSTRSPSAARVAVDAFCDGGRRNPR